MVLVIDNYDSFTYNLVQYLGEHGADSVVCRSDAIDIPRIRAMDPSHIVISPGSGQPGDAGVSLDVIRELHATVPILGVSLGHQCIGVAFGGRVHRTPRPVHGTTSLVYHYGEDLFNGIPSPFRAMRYHSLIVHEPLPESLEVTAFTANGEVMAIRHRASPVAGVQFHPESAFTEYGKQIVHNFLTRYRRVG